MKELFESELDLTAVIESNASLRSDFTFSPAFFSKMFLKTKWLDALSRLLFSCIIIHLHDGTYNAALTHTKV